MRRQIWVLLAIVSLLCACAGASAWWGRLGENVPIIEVPPTTTPDFGISVTTETEEDIDPEPGDPFDDGDPLVAQMGMSGKRPARLFVYLVRSDVFKSDAPVRRLMPGVVGRPWRAITARRQKFHFALSGVASGSTYYVVVLRRDGRTLKYLGRKAVPVGRPSSR
jgi:hypothetical protein